MLESAADLPELVRAPELILRFLGMLVDGQVLAPAEAELARTGVEPCAKESRHVGRVTALVDDQDFIGIVLDLDFVLLRMRLEASHQLLGPLSARPKGDGGYAANDRLGG